MGRLPGPFQTGGQYPMSRRHGSDLHSQGLRLPQHARERIARLAGELCAAGTPVAPAATTRGLCMLALCLARGAAGSVAADAFRAAASAHTKVGGALTSFVLLLDVGITTTPTLGPPEHAPGGNRLRAQQKSRRCLRNQALRLPRSARDDLEALVRELSAPGAEVSASEAARGLCLLAVELADGAAGAEVMDAFRIAARDPTAQGMQRAVDVLRPLLDGEPSTTPDPPMGDDTLSENPGGGSIPPPSLPHAA